MNYFLSNLSAGLREVALRPLLFVAGVATATAGVYYLYNKYTDHQQSKRTEEESVQTDPEVVLDSVQPDLDALHVDERHLGEVHNVEVHQDEQTTNAYQGLRLLENETNQQQPKEILPSHLTLRLSFCCWQDRHTKVVRVKQHYTLMKHGAVSQSWWVLTHDFHKRTARGLQRYASARRVTLAVHIDGRLARVASYLFTKHYSTSPSWGVHGVQDTFWSCRGVLISDSRCVVTVPCGSEVVPYTPDSSAFHQAEESSRPQTNPEPDEERGCIEGRHVPALFYYCRIRGIDNFTFKLAALRQAFDIIFSDSSNYDYIGVVGNVFCIDLAFTNDGNVSVVDNAYNHLINMIENPASRMWIEMELAQIGIQQFNFMDICFELLLLGYLGRARVLQIHSMLRYQRRRGFLYRLLALISECTTSSLEARDITELYLFKLQAEMFLLLDNIFTLEEPLYTDPNTLAVAVKSCLWRSLHHFNEWLETDDI